MKNLPPKREFVEALSKAYEALLENALQKAHQSGAIFHQVIDEIRDDIEGLNSLTQDEVALLKEYIKRDLTDAATYVDTTGKELKDWLGFDLALIESRFWENFSRAADKTTLELLQIERNAQATAYSTGELAGIGSLVCDQCAETLHFHKPGHIPPCPKCHHTHFHRYEL